ncbi:sugar phosphate isomerase/epimerase family protein [Phycisphaerales bacterium AB-hyl4]|uniref:Sugar phosphate isomerase/epimerase family protein n=1 Tax=Natronomicrosphaera hydrolytica TaxID=3242702 RepID=A0ABV4U8Q4_9BACT
MAWTISAFADEAGNPLDEQVSALQRAGITFIDLRRLDGHLITDLSQDLAKQAKQKLDDADITVHMLGSPIGKIDVTDDMEIDLAKLRHIAKMRDVFGCNTFRIFSYYNRTGLGHDEWQQRSIDHLKQLIDLADELDLVLYHENEGGIFGDRSDNVRVIAELRCDRFKLIYDFANYLHTGEAGWEIWRKCKDITDGFHLKDRRKDGAHVPMGQGETHARAILEDAANSGWCGPCTIEPHMSNSEAAFSHGAGARVFADMPQSESFHIAATEAIALLNTLRNNGC